jgi:CDP-glucose 4,6-dehydratase
LPTSAESKTRPDTGTADSPGTKGRAGTASPQYSPTSKGGAEIAIASWRRSLFGGHPVGIASVRVGNVIGGGDWARDRIMPDCIRALQRSESIPVGYKIATRPWQHILDPLSGYLWLAAVLAQPSLRPFDNDI